MSATEVFNITVTTITTVAPIIAFLEWRLKAIQHCIDRRYNELAAEDAEQRLRMDDHIERGDKR